MKKNRIIFFSIFAGYQLFVFLFTMYVNRKAQSDFTALLPMLSYTSWFIYGSLLGMVLVVTDFVWSWLASRQQASQDEKTLLENNTLKARIYDLQQSKEPHLAPPAAKASK